MSGRAASGRFFFRQAISFDKHVGRRGTKPLSKGTRQPKDALVLITTADGLGSLESAGFGGMTANLLCAVGHVFHKSAGFGGMTANLLCESGHVFHKSAGFGGAASNLVCQDASLLMVLRAACPWAYGFTPFGCLNSKSKVLESAGGRVCLWRQLALAAKPARRQALVPLLDWISGQGAVI